MDLIQLTEDIDTTSFDCGDDDLNDFLKNDARKYLEKRIGRTFVLIDGSDIVAYFCLCNDKISRQEVSNGGWRKMKKNFPHELHLGSYPAVKIGRFAVSLKHRHSGMGSEIMTTIKFLLESESTYSIFRFLTVDAYLSAIPFYEKNDFKMLLPNDEDRHTRLMYFDMMKMPTADAHET